MPKPPPERKAATPAIAPILPNVTGSRIGISIFLNKGRNAFVAKSKTDEIPKAAWILSLSLGPMRSKRFYTVSPLAIGTGSFSGRRLVTISGDGKSGSKAGIGCETECLVDLK